MERKMILHKKSLDNIPPRIYQPVRSVPAVSIRTLKINEQHYTQLVVMAVKAVLDHPLPQMDNRCGTEMSVWKLWSENS